MSSYSDFSEQQSRTLQNKGAALGDAAAQKGQIWGSTVANLGAVIPQQVQAAIRQRAEQRKQAQITKILQESGGDLEKASQQIMGVDPELGSKLLRTHTEARKSAYELQELDWKYKKAKADAVDRMLGAVNDEDSYVRYVLARKELGDVQGVPDHYDPAWIRQQKVSHLSLKEQLDLEKPKEPKLYPLTGGMKLVNDVGETIAENPYQLTPDQQADNARQDAAAKTSAADKAADNRRADAMLSLAQRREQRESQNTTEPLVAVMKDGKAVLVRRSQAEGQTPASSGGADGAPKLTQAETTAAGYAKRIEHAEQTLSTVSDDIAKMGLLKFTAQSRMPAKAQSSQFQQFDQAARNFINAQLRRESGAAISQSEFDNAKRQYLPQPGDGPEVLAQKKQNRDDVYKALAQGAGKAYTPDAPATTTPKKIGRFTVEVQP